MGLTGGIATGKSTVAQFIKDSGHPVVNADELAHQALSPVGPIHHHIVKAFGQDILDAQGEIDRRVLGAKIFKDEAERLKLESFIHPYVQQKTREARQSYQDQGLPVAFYDVPLLYEKHLEAQFEGVIVVWCHAELQLSRLMKRSGLSPIEAQDRIRAQLPLEDKKRRADYLIANNDGLVELKDQTARVLNQILTSK